MTLKFAEIWFTGSGQRIFDILLNGQVVQSLFDPYAAAGAQFRAVDRTFSTTSSGTITIALNPIISNPKISAIEIVTATGSAGPVRLNAGGAAWTDGAVSWAADNYYNGGGQYSVPDTIAGTTAQPLYRTERWNLSSLMYSVPVANGNWDVTLRFAEIWFSSAGERVFDIYINASLVAYHFDIIAAAGGAFRAVDRTFYITSSAGSILVELRPVVSNPKISAIDITPAQNQPATCLLYVDQPSGSPTIIRSGGNAMGGTAALGVATQPAQGNWTLRVYASIDFRPPGGAFAQVASTSTDHFVPAGTPTGNSYSTLLSGVPLEPRGDGDYRVRVSAQGLCNNAWYTLTPNNPAPSPNLTVQRPAITANGIAGMWWLNGISDPAAGLYDQAQITGTSNCAACPQSLSFTITGGADKASLTCSSCNTTNAKAKAPSAYCNAQDVIVTANLGGFNAAAPVRLSVNTFLNARRITPKPPVGTTSPFMGGWITEILYQVEDLCTAPVGYQVSVNEAFGTRTPPTSQWLLPALRPGFVVPFADQIGVWPTQPGAIQPTTPQTPLSSLLVDQIPWFASLGSQTSGSGLLVMSADQMRYIDHGDHSSVP